ncbi:MAG: hypothetical protein MUE42_14085 [Opitutaceae bacterium]|nr:hypothetical protein [Opitutaceae bacterium]
MLHVSSRPILFVSLLFGALALFTPLRAAPAPSLHARLHLDTAQGDDLASVNSPTRAFRTIERSRAAIRSIPAPWTGDVELVLHGHPLLLQSPLNFGPANSDRDDFHLRITGDPAHAEGTILDAGVRLTGWSLHDRANNIWRAPAPSPASPA